LNRKAFVVAGIFLAVALIVPPYLLNVQHDADLDDIVNQAPNLADETQTQGILEDIDTQYQAIFSIAIATEVIAVILFVIFLWIGLKP
jgi:L-cystine uptake protein TcyP (sodium:dicarboxylate symporter family)